MDVQLTPYALILIAALALNLFVWSVVYGQPRKGPVNTAFLLVTTCASLWILAEGLVYYVTFPPYTRLLIMRLSGLFWIPIGFLFLNFVNRLLGREPNWFFRGFMYSCIVIGICRISCLSSSTLA